MRGGRSSLRGAGASRTARARSATYRDRPAAAACRSHADISTLQRARLLRAAVGLLAEQGYGAASVAAICARAGVSRRTYYEIFENREQCLAAILSDTEARVQREIAKAGLAQAPWREWIRACLWTMLCLADSEPALARACLVETQRAAGPVIGERERILARLAEAFDAGRMQGAQGTAVGVLTAEALVGAVITVLSARLSSSTGSSRRPGRSQPLRVRELLGELMSMIVLPYLGPGAARRELARPLPAMPPTSAGAAEHFTATPGPDPLAGLPVRLTYRTARVLQAVAALDDGRQPGPSNRQIAEHAGVADAGQISKLLARLQQHELIVNTARSGAARGEANSWSLTDTGHRLVRGTGAIELDQERRSVA